MSVVNKNVDENKHIPLSDDLYVIFIDVNILGNILW